jgi:hypothetical protein
LVVTYAKDEGLVHIYRMGLAVWDDATKSFKELRMIWDEDTARSRPAIIPDGHAVKYTDAGGRAWVLFCNPFPMMRCPATFEAWQNPNSWEKLTPPQTLKGAGTQEEIRVHTGSIAWNPWRKRWVSIFSQSGGKSSNLGEVWYAEARAPTGPWGPAVKILSHDNYTFYNPSLHSEFTPENSPILLFEGTYATTFARDPPKTPRYDYNQILYRLDLDDPRLAPAHEE